MCFGGFGACLGGELVYIGTLGPSGGGMIDALVTVDALVVVDALAVVDADADGAAEGAVLSTGAGELTWIGSFGASF